MDLLPLEGGICDEIDLHHIGKIGSALIEINGITVIAGENNSGKVRLVQQPS